MRPDRSYPNDFAEGHRVDPRAAEAEHAENLMVRSMALTVAIAVSLLAVSGAGGSGAQTPKRGGTVVIAAAPNLEPACLNGFVDACSTSSLTVNHYSLVLAGAFEV